MAGKLSLGVSKVNICPPHPVQLAGFAARRGLGTYEQIKRPIYARVFFFRSEDEDGAARTAVVVSADLIWWGSDRAAALKERIRKRWGVPETAILLHGTHSHSGPQTSARFTTYLGESDPEYLKFLEDAVLEGIGTAACSLDEVAVEKGSGLFALGINRRNIARTPPDPGPADHQLSVVRFRTREGKTKGLLVHYACHPVITRENVLSCEFPGVAMEEIENRLGGEAVAAYLQGTCGDVNPSRDGRVWRGTDDDVARAGLALADAAMSVLGGPLQPLPPAALRSHSAVVPLPLQPLPPVEELEKRADDPGVVGEWSRRMLAEYKRLQPFIGLELTRLTVAEGLSLLAMNAEVVVEYGLFVKGLSAGETLPVGYTNGMFGYIPTARQIAEGGYESIDSTVYFAMPAPFAPEVETVVRNALAGMLEVPGAPRRSLDGSD